MDTGRFLAAIMLAGALSAPAQEQWTLQYADSCTGDWRDNWLNDASGVLSNDTAGMRFRTVDGHDVVWFLPVVHGDVRIECDVTNNGSSANAHIIFIQASGANGRDEDIMVWRDLRSPADMSWYQGSMNNVQITMDSPQNEVRIRQNAGATLLETYTNTDIFDTGVRHHIVAERVGRNVSLTVAGPGDNVKVYTATLTETSAVTGGRIGFRQMGGRDVTYQNLAVYALLAVDVRTARLVVRQSPSRAFVVVNGRDCRLQPGLTAYTLRGRTLSRSGFTVSVVTMREGDPR